MNIINVKQIVKTKVNSRDIKNGVIDAFSKYTGIKKEDVRYSVIPTDLVPGVRAGASIIALSDSKYKSYYIATLGTSVNEVGCVLDTGDYVTISLEYVMQLDKKVVNGIPVEDFAEELKSNADLCEALKIMSVAALYGKKEILIHGVLCGTTTGKEVTRPRFSGFVVKEATDKDEKNIEFNVIGKSGSVHVYKVIPVLEKEFDSLEYFNETFANELVAVHLESKGKGLYTKRATALNFAELIDTSFLTDKDIEEMGLKKDKNGLVIIDTADKLKEYDRVANEKESKATKSTAKTTKSKAKTTKSKAKATKSTTKTTKSKKASNK